MTRRDVMLRLHRSLVARRDELRRRLGGELEDLRSWKSSQIGDAADMAFDSGSEEVFSQLAELESRELSQIERALGRLRQGTYGICESCQKKIPVARLNALPFSTTCIDCQRAMELYGSCGDRDIFGHWEKVLETQAIDDQAEIDLSEIELEMSAHR